MKKFKIVVSIISLILVIILLTLIFYMFFSKKTPRLIENISIKYGVSEQKYTNYQDDLQYESESTFTVENKNNMDFTYNLVLKDNSSEIGLNKENINYQLYVDNKIVHENSLSYLTNNIIDTRTIKSKGTYSYTLKIWTDKENMNGKVYEYKIEMDRTK